MIEINNFRHDISISLGDNNNYIKEQLLKITKKFHVDAENLPDLLGVSSEKIKKILQDEPYQLSDEEEQRINYYLAFLAEGFAIIDANERIKVIIDSVLIDEYNFSYESLAAYANVPYEVFKSFYDDNAKIETKYLINICVNLLMLMFVLKNTNI